MFWSFTFLGMLSPQPWLCLYHPATGPGFLVPPPLPELEGTPLPLPHMVVAGDLSNHQRSQRTWSRSWRINCPWNESWLMGKKKWKGPKWINSLLSASHEWLHFSPSQSAEVLPTEWPDPSWRSIQPSNMSLLTASQSSFLISLFSYSYCPGSIPPMWKISDFSVFKNKD